MEILSFMESMVREHPWLVANIEVAFLLVFCILVVGRPVYAHPDRRLGKKHKVAQAERVENLERLSRGAKLGDNAPVKGDDLSDVEKEPLFSSLIVKSSPEATVITISLSGGNAASNPTRLPFQLCDAMKKIVETGGACGEFADDSIVFSPERTMLQGQVELQDGVIESLKGVVSAHSSRDYAPVLQVDNWAILKPSEKNANLMRIPIDKVPVILHAEYAAGLLTVTGLNLEDADIMISSQQANYTVKLTALRFIKAPKAKWGMRRSPWGLFSDTEEDLARLPLRLQWKDMNHVFVYATKKVSLEADGQTVDVISKAARITDSFWRTVFELWIPTIAIWTFIILNIRTNLNHFWAIFDVFPEHMRGGNELQILIMIFVLSKSLPDSFLEFVKYYIESAFQGLGQGLLLFYYGFKSLKGPRLEFPKRALPPPPPPRGPPPPPPKGPPASKPPISMEPPVDDCAKNVDDPDWEWPAFDEFLKKNGKVELKKPIEKKADDVSPFRVIYSRKVGLMWPDVVRVVLKSPSLIKIVQEFLPHNGDLQSLENPSIQGRDLFSVLDQIKQRPVPAAAENDGSKGELHLRHLFRFMDKEYNDVFIRQRRMADEKRVSWDMLWTFLTPGKKVVYNCDHTQQLLAAVVSKNSYVYLSKYVDWVYSIDLEIREYDGKSFRKCQIRRLILKFEGERPFTSLAVRPIEMDGVPEILNEAFLANGKRFQELALKQDHLYMNYSGFMYRVADKEVTKESADGRVMIDLLSFSKINPGHEMANEKPPPLGNNSGGGPVGSNRRPHHSHKAIIDHIGLDVNLEVEAVSDESLIFAPAIVYGFSFTLKDWGSFAVSGFSGISFSSNTFNSLVMEPDTKRLVYGLVSQYVATPVHQSEAVERVDPIDHKGEGCIFLCYGPPGTGKTMTAESVAENIQRPLWSLSVADLGISPNTLEKNLTKVLKIATTWRAVLMLDEADTFLEKRKSTGDLTRNAMTGVFLRFLEYYRGVLFLTTNRIETFDNAFRSRISMFLHYPKLSALDREQVWRTLLDRAGAANVTAEFVSQMAAEKLNGREIRNTVNTAQIWAKRNGETLEERHVRYVTRVLVSSLKTLVDTMKIPEGDDEGLSRAFLERIREL